MLRLCSRSRVRQYLSELPKNLDETYERLLMGIHIINRGHVQRLLQCLAFSIRPLRVDEAAAILTFDPRAVEGEAPTLNADSQSEDEEQEVLSACPSFLTIIDGHNSRVVQFSHSSMKDFLTSERLSTSRAAISRYHIVPEAAHTTLAQLSLGVLLRLDDHVNRRNATRIPLIRYATRYWVSHAQFGSVSSRIIGTMKTLFDLDKPHFAAWVRLYDMDSPSCWCSRWNAQKPLYYSVLCGFYDLVEHLLEKHSQHVNAIGGIHDYPLVAALQAGHIEVAELLCRHGADVDVQGTKDGLLLHRAIEWPNNLAVGAARFLLAHGADVDGRRTDLSTSLHLAADQGNLEVAEMLLQHGADINSRNIGGKTPLHLAAVQGHVEVAQMLLQRGADVNSQDVGGETPLQLMLQPTFPWGECNRLNLIKLLLEYGADVNSRDKTDATALHNASLVPNLEVARVLLDHGANINAEDNQGQTPLLRVSGDERYSGKGRSDAGFDMAQLLVEHGADVNTRDKEHETPLHLASYIPNPKLVQLLLDHGADVHATNSRQKTPFHRVSQAEYPYEDRFAVAQLLVENGADPNTRNKGNETWLHLATNTLNLKLVQMLLDRGANVNAKDNQGWTPLHRVLFKLKAEDYYPDEVFFGVAQLLVEHGANVDTRDKDHVTLLHLASYFRERNLVRVLLSHGAYVNAEDDQGRTPLYTLFWEADDYSDEDFFGVAQLLVERGAVLNAREKNYETPLHLVSYLPDLKLVQMLLDRGANVNAEDNRGRTPLHRVFLEAKYYSDEEFFDVVQLLVGHGADVNAQDNGYETPLHLAFYFPKLKLVRMLLDHGANVNAEDNHGRTPLLRVLGAKGYSDEDCFQVAQLFVDHGADVNARDDDHETPLHLAFYFLEHKLVRLLLDHGANINAEDSRGRAPLHRVLEDEDDSEEDRLRVAQLLMERGADANKQDNDHETPLHLASRVLSLEVAWILLGNGADIKVENREGKIPFQLAQERLREEIKRSPSEYSRRRAWRTQGVALISLLYGC
jgi:ankyrin repeat protein